MNKQLGIVFLTALTLACSGQAQESADSTTTAEPPPVISWKVDVSVDCAAMEENPERCIQSGDRLIMVDEDGSGSHPDLLILIREKDNLRYGYRANILDQGNPSDQQIEIEFLDHVGCTQEPLKKRLTVNNLSGGVSNDDELRACLGRFTTQDPDGKIGYADRIQSCMTESSMHWRIETTGSSTCDEKAMLPPDDGQGTGTGGN